MIAEEDIYTGDGTLRAEKDTVVETLTTGEDGTAKSGLLYLCLLYTSIAVRGIPLLASAGSRFRYWLLVPLSET